MSGINTPSGRTTAPLPPGAALNPPSFTRRLFLTVGVVAAAVVGLLLVWFLAQAILLAYTGVLVAVFLHSLSDWVSKHTPLSYGWALALVIIVLLGLVGVGIWLLAPSVAAQIDELTAQIPRTWNQLEQRITRYGWARALLDQVPDTNELVPGSSEVLRRITGIFSTTAGAIASCVVILFSGLYLAIDPALYRNGLVRLLPPAKRERFREVLGVMGYTLRWWLIGKIAAMMVIGVLTTLGLWLLDVPLALTLGLIAGLLSFIPNIGPTLALVPALLIALTQGVTQALYVFILYMAVQAIESYLLTPLIEQQTISLPPALTLLALTLLGLLFGGLGLLLAAPLTATVMVLVKMLYIEDILGDSIEVAGEDESTQSDS